MIVSSQLEDICLQAECDDDLEPQARALLSTLAEMHTRGPALRSGSLIQYGWVDLLLEDTQTASPVLRVCEPDFLGAGVQQRLPRVDYSLRVLREQASLLHALGCTGEETRYTDSVVLASGCLLEPRIYLERRSAVREGDSGWFIGPVEPADSDELEAIPAHQLLSLRPEVMPVLGLPRGFIATFNGEHLEAILDQEDRRRWPLSSGVAQ